MDAPYEYTRYCRELKGFDHKTMPPGTACLHCNVDAPRQQSEASNIGTRDPTPVIVLADSPQRPRLLGKLKTPASMARTNSITKDQAVKEARPHVGRAGAMHSGDPSMRGSANNSGVTAANFMACVTVRHQFYDPETVEALEVDYTSNKSFSTYFLMLKN